MSMVLFAVLMLLLVGGVAAAAMSVILFLGVHDDVDLAPRRARLRPRAAQGR